MIDATKQPALSVAISRAHPEVAREAVPLDEVDVSYIAGGEGVLHSKDPTTIVAVPEVHGLRAPLVEGVLRQPNTVIVHQEAVACWSSELLEDQTSRPVELYHAAAITWLATPTGSRCDREDHAVGEPASAMNPASQRRGKPRSSGEGTAK